MKVNDNRYFMTSETTTDTAI